jgi:malonate transporter
LQDAVFTITAILPVFSLVALGYGLKKIRFLTPDFVRHTSDFVFRVALPSLVFRKIAGLDLNQVFSLTEVIFVIAGILLFFLLVFVFVYSLSADGRQRGAIIQGAYRSNFAIIGLAVIGNLYGETGIGHGSLLLTFVMPLFNVLAVLALTIPRHTFAWESLAPLGREIIRNPLILAMLFALFFAFCEWQLPALLGKPIDYLAATALPIALLGIGNTLEVRQLLYSSFHAYLAAAMKVVLFPAIMMVAAIALGFRGQTLGILFILFGTPTAIASFMMAEAMDSDARLTANIIIISTIASIFTLAVGLLFLRHLGFV